MTIARGSTSDDKLRANSIAKVTASAVIPDDFYVHKWSIVR